MLVISACDSKSFCSIYNIAVNTKYPNDIFKIIFGHEGNFGKITLVTFYKKESSNTSACKLSLI